MTTPNKKEEDGDADGDGASLTPTLSAYTQEDLMDDSAHGFFCFFFFCWNYL